MPTANHLTAEPTAVLQYVPVYSDIGGAKTTASIDIAQQHNTNTRPVTRIRAKLRRRNTAISLRRSFRPSAAISPYTQRPLVPTWVQAQIARRIRSLLHHRRRDGVRPEMFAAIPPPPVLPAIEADHVLSVKPVVAVMQEIQNGEISRGTE